MKRTIVAAAALAVLGSTAGADIVDFESVPLGVLLGPVATATNSVSFGVGTCPGACLAAYVANVGSPQTAFAPNDTPEDTSISGHRFLTDEPAGPNATRDYFMWFLDPVLDLTLNLYDYRIDGGPGVGDMAVLTVYSDLLFTTAVGTATFTVTAGLPDGNIETLSVLAPTGPILSAAVRFVDGPDGGSSGADVGTGIDNIEFTTVPEPGSVGLLGAGLLGLWRARRPRKA